MLATLRTVENSLNAAKFTLTNALALERTVAPPPSVRVRVRPVIGTRKVRMSHRGASSTKVNKVPLPSTGSGVLDPPPQLVKAATARPIVRPRTSVRLIIRLPSIQSPLVLVRKPSRIFQRQGRKGHGGRHEIETPEGVVSCSVVLRAFPGLGQGAKLQRHNQRSGDGPKQRGDSRRQRYLDLGIHRSGGSRHLRCGRLLYLPQPDSGHVQPEGVCQGIRRLRS